MGSPTIHKRFHYSPPAGVTHPLAWNTGDYHNFPVSVEIADKVAAYIDELMKAKEPEALSERQKMRDKVTSWEEKRKLMDL